MMKLIRTLAASAFFCLVALPAHLGAQTPGVPIGIVGAAVSAEIGGSAASPGATVFSGDALSTENGGSLLVKVGQTSIELQGDSSAHIYRAPYGAVLELKSGAVVYSTPGGAQNVVIVANDVRVTPSTAGPELGKVTIDDPCNVTVQSDRGEADVRVGAESRTVESGKAYRVRAENSISYRKYLSPDDTDYHRNHEHAPCAAAYHPIKGRPPIAGGQSRFLYVAAGAAAGLTTFGVIKAMESPNRP